MDILNGTTKESPSNMAQMRLTLEWANTMNILFGDPDYPSMTLVEKLLLGWGSYYYIFPEPEPVNNTHYNLKSLDWRISTTLGLYVTEGIARAFQDITKGSMLYRQASNVQQSYVRYMNNVNEPMFKEGWRDGRLDWVEMRDPRWSSTNISISHDPWDVWAPQNGYTEIGFKVQRNGYGYGLEGLPVKLAVVVLATYLALVLWHVIMMCLGRLTYHGFSNLGEIVALAWNSPPSKELENTSVGIEKTRTWRHIVRVRKSDGSRLQLVLTDEKNKVDPTLHDLQAGVKYS